MLMKAFSDLKKLDNYLRLNYVISNNDIDTQRLIDVESKFTDISFFLIEKMIDELKDLNNRFRDINTDFSILNISRAYLYNNFNSVFETYNIFNSKYSDNNYEDFFNIFEYYLKSILLFSVSNYRNYLKSFSGIKSLLNFSNIKINANDINFMLNENRNVVINNIHNFVNSLLNNFLSVKSKNLDIAVLEEKNGEVEPKLLSSLINESFEKLRRYNVNDYDLYFITSTFKSITLGFSIKYFYNTEARLNIGLIRKYIKDYETGSESSLDIYETPGFKNTINYVNENLLSILKEIIVVLDKKQYKEYLTKLNRISIDEDKLRIDLLDSGLNPDDIDKFLIGTKDNINILKSTSIIDKGILSLHIRLTENILFSIFYYINWLRKVVETKSIL